MSCLPFCFKKHYLKFSQKTYFKKRHVFRLPHGGRAAHGEAVAVPVERAAAAAAAGHGGGGAALGQLHLPRRGRRLRQSAAALVVHPNCKAKGPRDPYVFKCQARTVNFNNLVDLQFNGRFPFQ